MGRFVFPGRCSGFDVPCQVRFVIAFSLFFSLFRKLMRLLFCDFFSFLDVAGLAGVGVVIFVYVGRGCG